MDVFAYHYIIGILNILNLLTHFKMGAEDEEAEDDENFDGDEDKDEDQNLAVYDFDEGEEGGSADGQDSEDEDIKPRMSKGGSKKVTQTVSQAHMCNYCNYTSPKR